jgi:sugar phosphate isomerase/epimerase
VTILVGSLAFQNWHRQVRQKGLGPQQAIDYVIGKTASAARQFGFSPMGIDLGVARFPSTDRAYLDELKAQLRELNLRANIGFRSLVCTLDTEVREAALNTALKDLEVAAYMGASTSNFGFQRNGRVTRAGQLRFAIDQLMVVGKEAKALGLRIFQENFDWWTAEELIQMCVESGCDNVGIQNDTGNWLITGEDPVESTKKVLPWTMYSHVRDYVLEEGTYNGVAVGEGLVDFERLLPELAKAGEKGTFVFSIEVDTDNRDEDQAFDDSCRFVKAWLDRNGHMAG